MVYEERFVGQYNIPPLQAVGWEGIFGFFTLGLLLIPVRKTFAIFSESRDFPCLVQFYSHERFRYRTG